MDEDFHFHEWAFLANADAEAFERRRSRLLASFLEGAGHRRPALESLQREIDRERAAAASPQAAVAAISAMMCHSFCSLVGELRDLGWQLKRLDRLTAPAGGDTNPRRAGAPSELGLSQP